MKEEELNSLAKEVAKILATTSQGVSEVPLVEEMDGINSLPCLRKVGDTEEVVEVPIPVLAAPSLEAAELAIDAAADADKKATLANNAATLANEKAALAGAAANSVNESKQAAIDAADAANVAKDDTVQATKDANEATTRLNTLSDHRDEVRDGYWWHWNEVTGEYENTGELAKGNTLFASFDIDPTTGELVCTTDEEYTGASFSVENGDLVITI